jgi:hypothetical protein
LKIKSLEDDTKLKLKQEDEQENNKEEPKKKVIVIENNSKSVCTDTYDAWGTKKFSFDFDNDGKIHEVSDKVLFYCYDFNKWKHAGTNVRVQF